MRQQEWNRIDRQLSVLIADRAFKAEQPEEWLALVRHLQQLLDTPVAD